jgi:translation initiation factor RLI1
MEMLAKLGTSIPGPALADCFTAALCVRLGNPWGCSVAAQTSANRFLKLFRPTQWEGYFNKLLPGDIRILSKIGYEDKPLERWQELMREINFGEMELDSRVVKMVSGDIRKKSQVKKTAQEFRARVMSDA